MKTYIVLYRLADNKSIDPPFGFLCEAEDADHAEEQCENAYADADIVWVWEGDTMADALADYWQTN